MNSQTNTWLCTQCHQQQKKASLLEEHFEAVEEEDEKAIGVLMHHQQVICERMSMKTQRPNPRRKYKLLGETHDFIWTAGTKFRSWCMQKSSHKNKFRMHIYVIKSSVSCHICRFFEVKDKWQKKGFLKTLQKQRGKINGGVRV